MLLLGRMNVTAFQGEFDLIPQMFSLRELTEFNSARNQRISGNVRRGIRAEQNDRELEESMQSCGIRGLPFGILNDRPNVNEIVWPKPLLSVRLPPIKNTKGMKKLLQLGSLASEQKYEMKRKTFLHPGVEGFRRDQHESDNSVMANSVSKKVLTQDKRRQRKKSKNRKTRRRNCCTDKLPSSPQHSQSQSSVTTEGTVETERRSAILNSSIEKEKATYLRVFTKKFGHH